MSKPRRSKTLEKVARTIKDADDFIEHVFGVANSYRINHGREAGDQGRAIRTELKTFNKHASALSAWLKSANRETQATAEHEALLQISLALHGSPTSARAASMATQEWLANAAAASERAAQTLKGKSPRHAPRLAAEALRATFEHHRLKVSYQASESNQSDAVRLLCALAKAAGDDMAPAAAREWLQQTGPRRLKTST
jgi:hypothetical protein